MSASSSCIFPDCKQTKDPTTAGPQRIRTIIAASKTRGDSIHLSLENELQQNPELSVCCHRDCVATYTSKHHISRSLKKRGLSPERSRSEPPVRRRRSEEPNFEFKKHCIFCGRECLKKDVKNPSRWREVVQCTTADMPGGKSLKNSIVQKCDERGDSHANEVRVRVMGAISDLHAADAQYHKDCYLSFMPKRNVQSASTGTTDGDYSIENLIEVMNATPDYIWTSVELHNRYSDVCEASDILSRKQLITNLQYHLGDRLVKFDISGCASLLCFRDHLPDYLRLVKVDDSEDSVMLSKITDKIVSECQSFPKSQSTYDLGQFRKSQTIESTSPTLMSLVSGLVSDGEITRVSTTLAQCIQSHVTKSLNQTTLGLAVKLHHKFGSKELVALLHEYGLTVTYDEVLRFRTSAALYTGSQPYTFRGLKKEEGTLGSWVDNYDLNVFTPNGCRETHALVVEITQQPFPAGDQDEHNDPLSTKDDRDSVHTLERGHEGDQDNNDLETLVIPRVKKAAMKNIKLSELSPITIQHYQGPQNPPLPAITHNHDGIPYPEVVQKMNDLIKALKADVEWLTQVVTSENEDGPPVEWSGYMNHLAREQGFVSKATKYIYGPLIDAPPSHPDTILTSIMYIEEFIRSLGQKYVYLVVDLQLYKVAIQIKWSNPKRWNHLIIRPGGMHTLMSFLGCVGILMKGSGLEEILTAAYKGVSNMLNGKAWPKALRGLRMVVTTLLADYILQGKNTHEELEAALQSARVSKTGRLWVDCLISPVLLAHMFVRSEREGNYVLQMHCLTKMLPYFFAAGHWNYARYISWHLIEFQTQLDEEALAMFYMGQHVCRHNDGSWNAVFSDQFGEQTYIRHGKAKGGLIGMTLSPEQVTRWVLSYHICNGVSLDLDSMFQDSVNDEHEAKSGRHKEEGKQRKMLDAADRKKLESELSRYPHPLQQTETATLFNVVNGRVAGDKVNVHDALTIGECMAAEFRSGLPDTFYTSIKSKVVTMETMKKGTKVGDKIVYDMEKFYGRLLVMSERRNVSLEKMFSFELAPLPSAIFDDYGGLRKSSKAQMLHKLAVWSEESNTPDVEIVDGNEMLYHTIWPKVGTVDNLLQNFTRAVEKEHEVIVVFDRYIEGSTKTHERIRRTGTAIYPKFKLALDTSLPARDSIMKSEHNKSELIQVFCNGNVSQNVHMIGEDNCVYKHEEADCNLISYVRQLIMQGHNHVQVVADDTDIFVLLVFFCWKWQCTARISMRKSGGLVIDINATAEKLGYKSLQLLAVHALTGCDTVSYFFGKGKTSAVSAMLKHEVGLEVLGDQEANIHDVFTAGRKFTSILYKERTAHTSMNHLRHSIFVSTKNTPKIKSLPPTDPALDEHIKRAHLQTMLWKAADEVEPPDVNISEFGWDVIGGVPTPRTGVSQCAPPELMKVVACGCGGQGACSRKNCSCSASGVSCTGFCKCMAQDSCKNPHTKQDDDDCVSEGDDEEQE